MTPSKYQQAIYDWATEQEGSSRVVAVAGSGKTTTLVEMSKRTSGSALFCAFNKHIQSELEKKLPNRVNCRTIHSIGFEAVRRTVGRTEIADDKYDALCLEAAGPIADRGRKRWPNAKTAPDGAARTPKKARSVLRGLVRMCLATLQDPADANALAEMADMYGVTVPDDQLEEFCEAVPAVVSRGIELTEEGVITFDDMIYYPATHDVNMRKYLWVMVDEAQDLSAAQLAVVLKSMKSRGRMVAVADPLQSLYGFTGADPWSFQAIGEATDAVDLPLSVCYRCGSKIVELAKNLVPQIEPAPHAEPGSVKHIEDFALPDVAKSGDMVICRTNAPVIRACLKLISQGVDAYVRGGDLKNSFLDIVDRVSLMDGYSWGSFRSMLSLAKSMRQTKLLAEEDERGANAVGDLYDAVDECAKVLQPTGEQNFKQGISKLFSPKKRSVVCSSIHRAKGLEADRVFLVRPDIVRLKWKGQQPWQAYQEQCCEYVAITRAKRELFLVEDPEKPPYSVGRRLDIPEKPGDSA